MNGFRRRILQIGAAFGATLFAQAIGGTAHATDVGVSVGVGISTPGVEIHAVADFYEPLGSYGRWETVGSYGRCWVPSGIEVGWSPYSDGYWVNTDVGWYWVSDEPWGWATYHYGCWDFDARLGWYWVPRIEWAPAWVSWREGGGYIGWAPISPRGAVASLQFVFVEDRHFTEPIRHTTVVRNDTTIINKTTVINNTKVVNNTTIAAGPAPERVEKVTGKKIAAQPAREIRTKEETKVAATRKNAPANAEGKVQAPDANQPGSNGKKVDSTSQESVQTEKSAPSEKQAQPRKETPAPAPKSETPKEKVQPATPPAQSNPKTVQEPAKKEQTPPAPAKKSGGKKAPAKQKKPAPDAGTPAPDQKDEKPKAEETQPPK